MERALLWLDDLDDFVFAIALAWRRICRYGLVPGFIAAVVLTPLPSTDLAIASVAWLSFFALSSVLAWLLAVLMPTRVVRPQASLTA